MNLSGDFFPTYQRLNPSFDADTFACAQETVRKLLATATDSDHPGMLWGRSKVAKPGPLSSTLALAFDNGYDIAIVLSKNSKALIEQTAKRLNSEFAVFVEDGEVEIYDIMHAPERFGRFELDSKLIFVAKKQADNLRRLIDLFTNHPAMAKLRTLIIDDEADSASIGYSKKEGLIEARTIAVQISDLRSAIEESSFLQVTATPYSLYLQPTEVEVENVTVFKPVRPQFTQLVPVSPAYVGGDTYFGNAAHSDEETLESLLHYTVDDREFDRLKKEDGRSFSRAAVLTSPAIKGFRHAIITFIVGGCIQRINGTAAGHRPKRLRYSFLLHSEAGKGAHEWQETLTETICNKLKDAADSGASLFRDLVRESYDDLKRSLAVNSHPVPRFDEVLAVAAEALEGEHITISKVNSDDDVAAMLDNSGQLKLRSPLNIFIGGQVIDRGVTLANLIGFYYGRRPKKFQQDTVLQHSRMYGYRRPDLSVTRFYTSSGIRHAMFQMEEFDSSLRAAIDAGGDRGVQFIRRAADGSIVPCGPNKILLSDTTTLRPGKRLLPLGFQSGYKTYISSIITEIDGIIRSHQIKGDPEAPFDLPLPVAASLLEKIYSALEFTESGYPNNRDELIGAMTHLSTNTDKRAERNLVWALWRGNRDLKRIRPNGRFSNAPDSPHREGKVAREIGKHIPVLMLLRQNGLEADQWRGTPFYWPVILTPANTKTAIFANLVRPDMVGSNDDEV